MSRPSSTTEKYEEKRIDEVAVARVEIDPNEQKRILRKIDWHLLPFISLLYLLSFLDRSNIGNAKVAGMATDAGLVGLKYNIVAAVFFIPYALAEIPSNILLKLVRPSIWIPSIMVAWGTVMTLMCLCNTYTDLVVARCFLGLAEAGLFPGATFYLSLWYRKRDVATRIAIFFSAATIAGAFGGILAYGIERMEGIGGLHGWQWIFCLEGLLTVFVAIAAFFYMHDYPETAKFLTEDERQIVVQMLAADNAGQAKHFEFRFVFQALLDYKSWVMVGIYWGLLIPVYGLSLFLPSIIGDLGFEAQNAQLLTVPPFVAGCLNTLLVGYWSDRLALRGPFIVSGCTIALVGYIITYTLTTTSAVAAYIGSILAAMGVFSTIAVHLAWSGSVAGGDVRKGVVIAMVIGFGNLGGVCSSFVYLDPPAYHIGHGTMIGWLGFSIVLSTLAMLDFKRRNRAKEAYCQQHGITEERWEEFKDMGSESPLFRYQI